MKAAVLYNLGSMPKYEDYPDPVVRKDEITIQVKAVALENIERAIASGAHFASSQFLPTLPAIVGTKGVGALADGSLVGFGRARPPYGAFAELVPIPKTNTVEIPRWMDAVTAAAMPASAMTSLFPLRWGACLKSGESVLINGATGVSGKLAVQIAKLLGAGRVVGTGRNRASIERAVELGADAMIDLSNSDNHISDAFKAESQGGYDVILDFLWGHPSELLVKTLVPTRLGFPKAIRFVQIGESAGSTISLSADSIRTSGLEILGGGARLTPDAISEGTQQVYEWIKADKIRMDIEVVTLSDAERVWKRADFQGKRIVVTL